jgi:hypothetical protein
MHMETCQVCGGRMIEQPTAYEMVNLPGVPKPSDRFYEQWFVCGNGHRKGYISGHLRRRAVHKVVTGANVASIPA